MSHPFPTTALPCRHAQMVRDSSFSYKIDYVQQVKIFLSPEGHQNLITGSTVIAVLLDGMDFTYWWICIGKGLRLQPAQQAFLLACSF